MQGLIITNSFGVDQLTDMKKIYYLAYYDIEENQEEHRNFVLSAANKISYIINALEKLGFSVEVVSASQTLNKTAYSEKVIPIGNQSKLRLFKTLPWGNKFRRIISLLYQRKQIYNFLVKRVTKEDIVLVYHSLSYLKLLKKAKRTVGFKLLLEVEEIYSDVTNNPKVYKKEMELFKVADAYLFPTELLNKKGNTEGKPHVIIYGTYNVERKITERFNDGRVHCVYAGTFDPRKGGGAAAAAAGYFLDEKYHIHILGFGSEKDKKLLIDTIEDVNRKSKCKVTYDGLLSGEAYIRFIQSCHIGLSTQNPNAAFNLTSFPSKVLSYLANGLRVVSIKILALEESRIGDILYYYNDPNPIKIAETICSIDFEDEYDSRQVVKKLDVEFLANMQKLLGDE